ncbi:type I restriction endonuclease subunit R [Thiomicrorhabdus lithotrophica]|uniref:Type I restriction enzyme endonuclease subunit n=1 Tax=Thiomicrorhabdus lithotrophica TaxID=2949997 RepID=A0ABY8CBV2_9GAMM|nr:type I restriction endonuclease subunit R [Thiomicrorhabdus lithotrophica]WEJ63424.1 type I restriction endonuclease subunit R [Thiomicrorhabdus lithotrophica]
MTNKVADSQGVYFSGQLQSEAQLENNLIQQLSSQGYERVSIETETELLSNLKSQLEKHNKTTFSDNEFSKILNHLNKGNVYERAQTLRDKFNLKRDDDSTLYIEFIDQIEWCQNQYQVTNQVTIKGEYENRYDVTILINGLPLVQIELKRRGLELKEAFNQTNRYHRHSYGAGTGLFQYIQLFVISNGVNTKYYANNRKQSFKQTFFWSDKDNQAITQLESFAKTFLEKCHLSKMITKYIVLNETDKILMVLRPYQYFAVEAIIDKVKNSVHNGYIWHTTGSGKTLTSFKAAQILTNLPKVDKVVFCVDRKDLDYQTAKEFNSFSEGSVDSTDNTQKLVQQFGDDTKLIVTTIQKLNTAIMKERYKTAMEPLKDKHIIFIFDECHRSQFGETHQRITEYFNHYQMFGFTGTPIFAENVAKNKLGKRTTKDLFGECLHKYVITDAIRDDNVLKFAVEYIRTFKQRDTVQDIEVQDIDTKEVMESPQRLEAIVDYIIANHDRKTHAKEFTGMMCVSSVDVLTAYYDIFKAKKEAGEHNLKIATIFSYAANEDDKDADDSIPEETTDMEGKAVNQHSRDKLESYIGDYNQMFGTKYTTKDSKSFYNYYNELAKRVRDKQVDILLVVNMFLTGFDSKPLNTLYVDKNLKYHGLIQAFSRTNRIMGEKKSQGNIVCFRNLKQATDDAIGLFSDKNAKDTIIMEPYENYVEQFNEALEALRSIAPDVDSVNDLQSEEDKFNFIKAYRELMRVYNVLATFTDFEFDDLAINEQEYADYGSKYLDLYDSVKNDRQKEKVSILNDVDFELELIHRDEINVTYILKLLGQLKDAPKEEHENRKKNIIDMLSGDVGMRSKKELIEKFIHENLPEIQNGGEVEQRFKQFWQEQDKAEIERICSEEGLDQEKVKKLISSYLFTEKLPYRDDVVDTMHQKPTILKRKTVSQRILDKMLDYIKTFVDGAPE